MPKNKKQSSRSFERLRMRRTARAAHSRARPNIMVDRRLTLLFITAAMVHSAVAEPPVVEDTSQISAAQIAMTVVTGQLYLLTQVRDIYNALMRENLSPEEYKLIKDRLIAVNINFVRDFAWAFCSGVGMASTMVQNSGIALLTIMFTIRTMNSNWLSHETSLSILRSGIASTLGLLAWCGPLQSKVVLEWGVWAQAVAVGLCEGPTQVISAALFDFIRSRDRSINPFGIIKTLLEGIFNAPAGAVWLLMASIPQKDAGTDMAGVLTVGESAVSALSVACAVATTNYLCSSIAPKLAAPIVEALKAVPSTVSTWFRPVVGFAEPATELTPLLPVPAAASL